MRKSITHSNWFRAILFALYLIFPGMIFYFIGQNISEYGFERSHAIGIVITSLVFILLIQLVFLSYIRMTITENEIIFHRPYQAFTWKRNKPNSIIIKHTAWTELVVLNAKDGALFYFRKERQAVCFISVSGSHPYVKLISKFLPDHLVKQDYVENKPSKLYKEFKKLYPERVMRG